MAFKGLHICYAGSLGYYSPLEKQNSSNFVRQLFWTYRNNTVDSSTRSAYYLIRAVKILKDKYQINDSDLKISLWGSIHPMNKSQIIELGLDAFFDISGYFSKKETVDKLKSADLLFLPLEMSTSKEFKSLFIPGKLFEYLSLNKPILSPSEPSDCQDILLKSNLGIITKPNDEKEIAEVIYRYIKNPELLNDLKPNVEFINTFTFIEKTKELAKIFDQLIK
jgi:glycosyltransferase involved in cell wall biosynthesis